MLGEEAHLWLAEPTASEGAEWLDEVERERHQRYLRAEDRQLFLSAHVLLRRTLSQYAPVPPQDWQLELAEHGRPEIVGRPLRFSLSHAPGLVACLVTSSVDCGVDAEDSRRVDDPLQVATTVFSSDEQAALRQLEPALLRDRFFVTWTLKEAYVKARGLGLALPLDRFSFSVADDEVSFSCHEDPPQLTQEWQFEVFRPSPEHIVSVALRIGRADRMRVLLHHVAL
jgi:4'-phosphopantetheinyl transferase